MLSARNQYKGTIKDLKLGNVMAEVVVSVGNMEIVSAITRDSASRWPEARRHSNGRH